MTQVAETLGGIDGVVNSAGIAADIPTLDSPSTCSARSWTSTWPAPSSSPARRPDMMKDNGGGAIVNLASISGVRGSKGRSAYGSSKGAVCVLTQVMANDLARYRHPRERRCAGPGRHADGAGDAFGARIGRCGHGICPCAATALREEIANVIEFLLDGTKSSYVTGEIVAVDGGFRGAGVIADD